MFALSALTGVHLGLIATSFFETSDRSALEARYGPIKQRIHGKSAPGESAPDAHPSVPRAMLPGVILALVERLVRGEHKRSAFFDEHGEPVGSPRVLSQAEHDALPPYRG